MSTGAKAAWRNLLSAPVALSLLLLISAAVGLRPGLETLARRLEKLPIQIRRPLADFDYGALRSFHLSPTQPPAKISVADIGTSEVLYRTLDARGPSSIHPQLLVTYYSNPKDRVPHTPEVCYRQIGIVIDSISNWQLDVPELSGPKSIPVRQLDSHRGSAGMVSLYTFCVNGDFCADRERLRWVMGLPGARYVYFSKIEVIAEYGEEAHKAAALESITTLLREALPPLLANHFPRSQDLNDPPEPLASHADAATKRALPPGQAASPPQPEPEP